MQKLTEAELNLLEAVACGQVLKSHRYLDGSKVCQLHSLDGSIEVVANELVQSLQEIHLIDDNKKFPAATYWLTKEGQRRLDQRQKHLTDT